MSIRMQDCVRRAIAAVMLLAVGSVFHNGLAQNTNPQPSPDKASSLVKANASGPSNLESLSAGETIGVLGKSVVAANGEGLGLITDVIVDRTGQPRAAVIDFGGFLGVGSRKIAVDWNLLRFDPETRDRPAVLALRRHEIRAAPEYRGDTASAEMVGPPFVGSSSGDAGK